MSRVAAAKQIGIEKTSTNWGKTHLTYTYTQTHTPKKQQCTAAAATPRCVAAALLVAR